MARTFRRKGFEKTRNRSGDKQGSKVAGFYTEWDTYTLNHGINGHGGHPNFRVPTPAEKAKKYYLIHGESKNVNSWTMPRWFRKEMNAWNEQHNQTEARKCERDCEYDPVFIAKFPSQSKWWEMR